MASNWSPSDRSRRRPGFSGLGWQGRSGRGGVVRGSGLPSRVREPSGRAGESSAASDALAGRNLIYGVNPVREALRGRRRVRAVLVVPGRAGAELQEAVLSRRRNVAEVRGLLTGASSGAMGGGPPVFHVSVAELTARVGTGDHQGIAAEVDPYPYVDSEVLLREHTLVVALDEVQDPHNLGAIIRTAEAARAGVIIPRHRAAEITAAVVKASAGATEHATVARVRNTADFLAHAKQAGFWIYGATADAQCLYTTQDYRYPTCFVVGSEGEGLGRRVASLCDVLVSLPLAGRVDSLNVSVSAGILLYEAVRQRT